MCFGKPSTLNETRDGQRGLHSADLESLHTFETLFHDLHSSETEPAFICDLKQIYSNNLVESVSWWNCCLSAAFCLTLQITVVALELVSSIVDYPTLSSSCTQDPQKLLHWRMRQINMNFLQHLDLMRSDWTEILNRNILTPRFFLLIFLLHMIN